MSTPKPVLHNTEDFPLSEWERHWKETQRIENELGKNEPEDVPPAPEPDVDGELQPDGKLDLDIVELEPAKDATGSDEPEKPAPKKKAAKKPEAKKP